MERLDPRTREALRFVRVDADDLDLSRFPDFLIIGPQRTGTTWLHRNLVEHPQVFMPKDKELYYFSTLRYPENHPADLGPVRPELSWYLAQFEESAAQVAAKDAACRAAFGEPYEVSVRGEATATYAAGIDHEVIDEILVLNPDLKVILMVRNPVDRAWSHAKKDLSKNVGRPLDSVTEAELREFFSRGYQLQCGRYTAIYEQWFPRLRDGHLFVGAFDRVRSDPTGLLCEVFAFLGVRADPRYVGATAAARVGATEAAPIPARLRSLLEELYADELARLATHGFRWD